MVYIGVITAEFTIENSLNLGQGKKYPDCIVNCYPCFAAYLLVLIQPGTSLCQNSTNLICQIRRFAAQPAKGSITPSPP